LVKALDWMPGEAPRNVKAVRLAVRGLSENRRLCRGRRYRTKLATATLDDVGWRTRQIKSQIRYIDTRTKPLKRPSPMLLGLDDVQHDLRKHSLIAQHDRHRRPEHHNPRWITPG